MFNPVVKGGDFYINKLLPLILSVDIEDGKNSMENCTLKNDKTFSI